MQQLNLPTYQFKIKSKENKQFIFDSVRKKYVILTPEEWVRQHVMQFLIQFKKYPASLTAVEKELKLHTRKKRTDIVIYNTNATPEIIVECKRPTVQITQATFDQIARYNMALNAKYLMITNGINHYFCSMDTENETYTFLRDLPECDYFKS
ncbi:type I restriction enzyme HsdR N-terminal domain-containing protein [Aureivirga marina]|uniref:type I restriction enzyme HsdR N-terminal domain-containing protein n=1 Tax=Aureivirga marina TaxID=1182451 RepID=UPI0018C96D7E|nr:type I restriction enzyme HsdR N-terminal domain-containing protein [Aureivirga marina]